MLHRVQDQARLGDSLFTSRNRASQTHEQALCPAGRGRELEVNYSETPAGVCAFTTSFGFRGIAPAFAM